MVAHNQFPFCARNTSKPGSHPHRLEIALIIPLCSLCFWCPLQNPAGWDLGFAYLLPESWKHLFELCEIILPPEAHHCVKEKGPDWLIEDMSVSVALALARCKAYGLSLEVASVKGFASPEESNKPL